VKLESCNKRYCKLSIKALDQNILEGGVNGVKKITFNLVYVLGDSKYTAAYTGQVKYDCSKLSWITDVEIKDM
jgi:hypothetical protein